ncbi:MAG: flagellar hook-basal body complex protein FliE [Spirochaetes bacterium]|nr:flagellar hook-basal body complex protein FliE [Spirochaetota bacterium]
MDPRISSKDAIGHKIFLQTSDPRHLKGSKGSPPSTKPKDFKGMVMDELNTVNQLQLKSDELSRRLVTDPDSVDVHDVTIALAEANMALNITKSVVDRVIRAYRDIITAR